MHTFSPENYGEWSRELPVLIYLLRTSINSECEFFYSLCFIKSVTTLEMIFFFLSEPSTTLQNWTSFLYVDTSESPFLTARWQQVPLRFGVQNYSLKMFGKLEGSEMNLQASAVVRGTDDNRELSYKFDDVLASGVYHFEVRVLNNTCTNDLCQVSRSPDIPVRKYNIRVTKLHVVP